jgi:hypothetical protein
MRAGNGRSETPSGETTTVGFDSPTLTSNVRRGCETTRFPARTSALASRPKRLVSGPHYTRLPGDISASTAAFVAEKTARRVEDREAQASWDGWNDNPINEQPLRLSGLRLGGGRGMVIAQSRCPWWIEGMLRLVKAIEDAPDPKRQRRVRSDTGKPRRSRFSRARWLGEPVNA